jgi:tetratricopeptide (TPR) repeat protein
MPGSDERQAPSATGKLATTPLASALIYARNRRLTGALELRAPALSDAHATLAFWRGRISRVDIHPPGPYFATIVHERGWIDTATLDATLLEVAKTKRLHGDILVSRGAITEQQRNQALHEQTCRKVQQALAYPPESAFAFFESRPSTDEPPFLVDPLAPVWRAFRDGAPPRGVPDVVAKYAHVPMRMVNEGVCDGAGFSPEERALATALAASPMSLAQLKASTTLAPARVDLVFYLLLVAKCLEPRRPSSGSLPATSATRQPSAPHSAPSSGEVATARPSFSFRVPSTSAMAAARPVGTAPAPASPEALGGAGIAARAAGLAQEDYFEALGVPEGASAEAVRAAFFRLAKLWQPDRLPPWLVSHSAEVAAILTHMTRAQQTLTNEAARRGWLAAREAARIGKGGAAHRLSRAEGLEALDKLLAKEDLSGVARDVSKLADAFPGDAEIVAIVAWVKALGGEADEGVLVASVAALDKAIRQDCDCSRAYYYRGVLHKRLANAQGAYRDFTRALQLDPNRVEAAREVRVYEMRARKGSGEHGLKIGRKK